MNDQKNKRRRPWSNGQAFRTIIWKAAKVDCGSTLSALFCIARGLRVRGWNKLCSIAMRSSEYYESWILVSEPSFFDRYMLNQDKKLPDILLAAIIFGEESNVAAAERTAKSLRDAFGPEIDIWTSGNMVGGCHCLSATSGVGLKDHLAAIVARSRPDWILPIKAGDTVSPGLGNILLHTAAHCPESSILYWDEDIATSGKREEPWIKPSWDELVYLSRDTISGSCVILSHTAIAVSETMADIPLTASACSELLLRTIADARFIPPHHIPLILTHRADALGFVTANEWQKIVTTCWPKPIKVLPDASNSQFLTVTPAIPDRWPNVSIIIPTRDQLDVLAACLQSLSQLNYLGEIEILIVDNGSEDPEALALLASTGGGASARVISAPGPFNFSTLNNLAARQAEGEFLCLLNNDIEAIDGDWLSTMIAHAILPTTGAVGAQLLYPDRTIQHAGVVIGMGNAAGHLQRGVQPSTMSHIAWHGVSRQVSAVTAACMVVCRDYFWEVNGLDEVAFAVAFNDVDFCLKLKARGLRNIYVAQAKLVHHESKSRGSDYAPENSSRFRSELANLQARWQTENFDDPHYSPLFSRASEQCVLQF